MLLDFSGVNDSLVDLGLIESVLYGLLYLLCEHGLDVLADKLAIDPVTISYSEEMGTSVLTQVRQHQERILVYFVGILW